VTRRLRTNALLAAVTMLAMTLLVSPLLLTPLATTVTFPFLVVVLMLVTTGIASAVVSIRERLFHPAPDAPRIARAAALGPGDYLDPFRRILPGVLGVLAAVASAALIVEWTRRPDQVDGGFAGTAVITVVVAAVVFAVMPVLERLMLGRPQPASDTLELAWDDAMRTTALGALRLLCALSAWMTFALALGALWLGSGGLSDAVVQQLPTWGVITLAFIYPSTGRRLRPELYPDWLRRPVVVGASA
jgi:hypothetical protein